MTLTDEEKRKIALLVGAGASLGYAINLVKRLPGKGKFGGITKLGVDYMHNYPKGYYAKGVTKWDKGKLIGKEFAKSAGRIAKGGLFVPETIAYKRTGIAPFVNKMFQNNNKKIEAIKNQFIYQTGGGIRPEDAMYEIKNLEKQVHHKLTSDFSNNRVFGSPIKADLRKYAQKYVRSSDKGDFLKAAGNKEIADYAASRWKNDGILRHDMKGLKYMKYKNIPFADVLRGAQFDPNMYKGMLALKGEKDLSIAINKLKQLENKYWTPNVMPTKDGKILFQVSPRWKSNFDWGGYNAVGIWDPKKSDKIRIMATDFRNLFKIPVPNPVLNFVDSKEISIKDATRKIAEVDPNVIEKPKPKGQYKPIKYDTIEKRKELAKTFRVGGTRNTLLKEQEQVFGRFQKVKSTIRNTMLKPNLFNKSGRRHLAKIAPSVLKRLGAAGLPLAAAYALYSKLSEE